MNRRPTQLKFNHAPPPRQAQPVKQSYYAPEHDPLPTESGAALYERLFCDSYFTLAATAPADLAGLIKQLDPRNENPTRSARRVIDYCQAQVERAA